MKVYDILREGVETPEEPYTPTGPLTDDEMMMAYNKLARTTMTKEEINDFSVFAANEGNYTRSAASAQFVLNRMHILIHGVAPEGESPTRAETMFKIPRRMIDFVLRQGDLDMDDITLNVENAKEELAKRPVIKKVKKEEALAMMADYYKQNRASIPASIKQYREAIVQDIMNGVAPDVAFKKYF